MIGVPWVLSATLGVGFNMYLNEADNRFWAEGNIFLIVNSIFMIIQWALSIPLIFEWQYYLKTWKILRLNALISAILYTLVYAFFVFEFFNIANSWTGTVDDQSTVLVDLLIGYNLVLHAPTVFINLGIVAKESSLELF